MRSLDATGYQTDKTRRYLRNYERALGARREDPLTLLELGVADGGSLLLWRDYLPQGVIVGLDIRAVSVPDPTGRIRVYQGRQDDLDLLDRIAGEQAPDGFDVIIDDASHVAAPTRTAFWHLFRHHLRARGLYVIEDWGTGYWDCYEDGRPFAGPDWLIAGDAPPADSGAGEPAGHLAGLVGFVKELVDECGMADVTKAGLGTGLPRASRFDRIEISHGQVFVVKAAPGDDPE